MKLISTALLAAGFAALSACGGGAEENVAANTAADEAFNVAPDDLGDENLLGNEGLGDEDLADNIVANDTADDAATENVTNGY